MISISTISHHNNQNETVQLEQQLQQVRIKEQFYRQQKEILLHEQAQLDRRKRNRRIFTRGGMLEAFMKKPLLLTDNQVYQLLRAAFSTWEVREAEAALISEAERAAAGSGDEAGRDTGNAGALGSTLCR